VGVRLGCTLRRGSRLQFEAIEGMGSVSAFYCITGTLYHPLHIIALGSSLHEPGSSGEWRCGEDSLVLF